ncbi:hypothetical protein DPMN_007738 [Dreissena polymorpha]|uniref:Uncharacterized protein n=1 Tax=Dreissena polymorpha TaxID=45954 RepID=A0A9D4RYI1_DREPO|nr:hypothetical protein DPMN_007738 [Dreissena polymorpha]
MELDGKLVPILHGIPSKDFHRIPYDSTADLQIHVSSFINQEGLKGPKLLT